MPGLILWSTNTCIWLLLASSPCFLIISISTPKKSKLEEPRDDVNLLHSSDIVQVLPEQAL